MSTNPQQASLAFERHGSGVPIVLLHGLTFDRRCWRPIVDRLGPGVCTTAIDLPAHGASPGPPCDLQDAAAQVHQLLESLDVTNPIVVGHSMSGGLAMLYAAAYPSRGVVTIDQPLDLRPFARLVHQLEPALRGDGFAETFERVFQASMGLDLLPADVRAEVLAGQRIRQDVVVGYWDELLRTEPDVLQARVDRLADSMQMPVLGVFGRQLDPPDRERLSRLPRAEVEVWPGAGHFPHLAEPDRFTDRLLAFAAHCEAAPAPAGVES